MTFSFPALLPIVTAEISIVTFPTAYLLLQPNGADRSTLSFMHFVVGIAFLFDILTLLQAIGNQSSNISFISLLAFVQFAGVYFGLLCCYCLGYRLNPEVTMRIIFPQLRSFPRCPRNQLRLRISRREIESNEGEEIGEFRRG